MLLCEDLTIIALNHPHCASFLSFGSLLTLLLISSIVAILTDTYGVQAIVCKEVKESQALFLWNFRS